MRLILASKSPRRKEILKKFRYEFEVIASEEEEVLNSALPPCEIVKSLAYQKANAVFKKLPNTDDTVIIGADTIVVFDGEILIKPKDESDQRRMLETLSGKKHFVYTGYCIISKNGVFVDCDKSTVTFNKLGYKTINDYVLSGLGLDKAGGYGIQDEYNLVAQIEGSYYNIVGLPIEKIKEKFDELGL